MAGYPMAEIFMFIGGLTVMAGAACLIYRIGRKRWPWEKE